MLGFVAGIAAIVAALHVPGLLFFRALGFTRLHALVAAPLYGAMMVGVLGIAYYEAGISCTVPSILGPMLGLSIVVYAVSSALGKGRRRTFGFPGAEEGAETDDTPEDWKLACLYVVCGIVACTVVFGAALPSPDAAYIRYDNQTHLNVSKSFTDSGMWSSLHPSRYLDLAPFERPDASAGGSFYPALLFALTAFDAVMTGLPATAAYNAVLFALCAVTFPLGMFAVMRVAFRGNRMAIALGAVATVAFTAFPWGVFIRGLFPNVTGYCLMAPALGSTIALLSQRLRADVIARGVVLWVCAMPALALGHPNAVFTAFIFIVAYTAHIAGKRRAEKAESSGRSRAVARAVAIAVVVGAALVVWVACLNAPPLSSVVRYFGNTKVSPISSLASVVLLKFGSSPRQYALAAVVVIGVVACVRKRMFWLLASAAWMALACFVVRSWNSPLAHFLAGFWYCDHVRLAAALCIFYMPIAALGLSSIANGALRLSTRKGGATSSARQRAFAGVALGIVCILVFIPSISVPGKDKPLLVTSYGKVYTDLRNMYAENDKGVYGSDEQRFVDRAVQITGEDLVINYPGDGSTFSYPVNGMKTFFRSYKTGKNTQEARTIRVKLNEYATDASVRDAVKSTGARYVLKLDQGVSYEDGTWFRQFKNPKRYAGIDKVSDDTPGFETVLSEGDMRLYRIED